MIMKSIWDPGVISISDVTGKLRGLTEKVDGAMVGKKGKGGWNQG